MIFLSWAQYPEADVAGYHVFRSIIGFAAPLLDPVDLLGLTLILKLNGGSNQTVTFNAVDDVATQINAAITGGQAYASIADPTQFIFRSDVREAPGSVQIVGGTALSALGLTARAITQLSESVEVATVLAAADPETLVEFSDPDGALQDFYAVSSIDSLDNESLTTTYKQPISATGALCVVEGIVTDLQGVRLVDRTVRAILKTAPATVEIGSLIDASAAVETLTGPDGRFSLPLLQGATVQFEIPSTNYSRYITVPAQAFAFITDLDTDENYQFLPDPQLGQV